jgi:predicted metal-dependent hydrolase
LSGPPVPEPRLSDEERAELARGVEQFNTGYYFECHDTLEELWSGLRGGQRDFFQGLIQVAVAFYHLGRGNQGGASSMLERALTRFARYPDRYFGFDLLTHRRELELRLAAIREGRGAEIAPTRWHFDDPEGFPSASTKR